MNDNVTGVERNEESVSVGKVCPKCGMKSESNFCPNCGQDLSEVVEHKQNEEVQGEDVEVKDETKPNNEPKEAALNERAEKTGASEKEKPKSKKKILIALIIAGVVIIGAIIAGVSVTKAKEDEKYVTNLNALSSFILNSSVDVENQCNLIQSVWHDAIYEEPSAETKKYVSGTDDFNEALENLFADEDFQDKNDQITASKSTIDSIMDYLKDPPDKYEKYYDEAVELYGKYCEFVNLAIDPDGSYTSYTDKFQELDSELLEEYNKYTTIIPSNESNEE